MLWNPDKYYQFQTKRLEISKLQIEWISGKALVPYFEHLGSMKDQYILVIQSALTAVMPGSPVFLSFSPDAVFNAKGWGK
jgi:trans-aconitate methyltransferase